ncbi:hypothetical protein [Streptosporangium pseudovulgare]|uniref:Uncharacterized protein n=1 Tax=Streptosporangium pseudovulgare TaxID=35765 RepID=A0ABQ2QL32_9ACTN|nr:hypothetical protein [Streptosporangium pseudovulgare]GGP85532.1 hypothetical protein GCM10010140_13580 [Streptosporangium pseudovulgare]
MLVAARELLAVRSPLDAELMVSDMVGAWWGRRLKGGDAEQVLGEGLVDYAAKAGSPAALTLLIALAYLGTARQAAKAEGAALALIERDVARPRWADRLGAVKPTGCYVSRDAYGDQDTVVCTFGYRGAEAAEEPHALVMVVDYNMRGIARDAWVSSHVDKLLEQARAEAEANPMLRFEEIEPQQARALLESAMKATAEYGDRRTTAPVSDSYSAYHAFARSRIKALPPGRKRPAPLHSEAPYSRDRRAMLAAEFLSSDAAEHLSDPSAASRCADHIIDYGCDQDFGRPLRVSPAKCEAFLLDWLPRKVMLSPAEQEAVPYVLSAWARFAARRTGLPEEGLRATLDGIWEATGKFAEAYRDPTTFGIDRDLLERLLPDGDLSALARRVFAFPFLQGTHGEIKLDLLNPADDADRRILLEIDHADERRRPDRDEHLAWHEEIAGRLWEGDPPQLWEAAQRLLDLGHDRHDVLHVLMEIVERIGDDPEELAVALDDIADIPDEPPGTGRPW